MKDAPLYVATPSGIKRHGVVRSIGKRKAFFREVDFWKDRMRILDSWSVNPDALDKLTAQGVERVIYRTASLEDNATYELTVKEIEALTKKGVASVGAFAGDDTIYVPRVAWRRSEARAVNTLIEALK